MRNLHIKKCSSHRTYFNRKGILKKLLKLSLSEFIAASLAQNRYPTDIDKSPSSSGIILPVPPHLVQDFQRDEFNVKLR